MPVYEYKCPSGHPNFDGVTTIGGHDKCPVCGVAGDRVFVVTRITAEYNSSFEDVDHMPPMKRQMLLRHKAYIESRKEDVASGALQIKEAGPKALRPQLT